MGICFSALYVAELGGVGVFCFFFNGHIFLLKMRAGESQRRLGIFLGSN